MEQPNIAKRFHQVVNETSRGRKHSPIWYLLLVILILVVGFDAYMRYGMIPQLRREKDALVTTVRELGAMVTELQQEIRAKDDDIFQLKTQLDPFEMAAFRRYPGTGEEALEKLAEVLEKEKEEFLGLKETSGSQKKEISRLKSKNLNLQGKLSKLNRQLVELEEANSQQKTEISILSDLGKYAEVATWTLDGRKKTSDSQMEDSPVAGWAKGLRRDDGGSQAEWECGSMALYQYRDMMEKHPEFPFPYFVLAQCLHARGEPSWQEYAQKGVNILQRTTRIKGHAPDHDNALVELNSLLEQLGQ